MACYTPIAAYRAQGGGVAFDAKSGHADRPLELPCGKCIGCRLARAREWSLRAAHEAQLHDANCFVTLTYDQEHVPADGSLVPSHWRDFAKRLRRRGYAFRFLMCGEYGGRSLRPHYHALLFGVDFASDRVIWRDGKYPLWTSPMLAATWSHGFVSIGALTRETAEYVARYTLKKVRGDVHAYRRVDAVTGEAYEVEPEFARMSRRPGLGARWFEKFAGDLYPSDEAVHEGRVFAVPRYYDKLLERARPADFLTLKAGRRARVHRMLAEEEARAVGAPLRSRVSAASLGVGVKATGELSFERRSARHEVALAKAKLVERSEV